MPVLDLPLYLLFLLISVLLSASADVHLPDDFKETPHCLLILSTPYSWTLHPRLSFVFWFSCAGTDKF